MLQLNFTTTALLDWVSSDSGLKNGETQNKDISLTRKQRLVIMTIAVRACTGFDRPAEDGEAIRGL